MAMHETILEIEILRVSRIRSEIRIDGRQGREVGGREGHIRSDQVSDSVLEADQRVLTQ